MSIDFQNFTPYASLIGGVMIGLAALLLMLAHGRVMGVSGILGGIVMPSGKSDIGWRVLFVIGMLAGPFAVIHLLDRPVDIMPAASGMILPVAGLIVGLGTAYAALPDCRRVRWWRSAPSWRPALPPSFSYAT